LIPLLEAVHTHSARAARGSYSQAVRVGSFLFISGQLPLDRQGRMVKGTVADEVKQGLSNVRGIVDAAGGTMTNLVQCTIYINDIANWAEVDEAYGAFLSKPRCCPRAQSYRLRKCITVRTLRFRESRS
jgi:2-iminobutanoate/2-iminopropanoate deaminase